MRAVHRPQALVKSGHSAGHQPAWGMARLGRRRRAWQAAISPGEAQAAFDPGIPEWDFLPFGALRKERERGEKKHPSTRRKRNQPRCRE